MTKFTRSTLLAAILLVELPTTVVPGWAQTRGETAPDVTPDATAQGRSTMDRWEFTLDGRVGAPIGWLRVGEFPPSGATAGGAPGTRLRLSDAGIHVSETLEGSVALHFTPRDAVRASLLYSFLRADSAQDRSVVYNGEEFRSGHLHTNADFSRFSLAYERALLSSPAAQLVGSLGLTYVYFNPTLSGHGHRNSEDFYLQELPVPIVGLRWDQPLGEHWQMRGAVSGGGLPRVDSLRQEGGTVYLQQSHADVAAGLVYRWGRAMELAFGYHFSYFFQHEKSREDDNRFELVDNGVRARFLLRF